MPAVSRAFSAGVRSSLEGLLMDAIIYRPQNRVIGRLQALFTVILLAKCDCLDTLEPLGGHDREPDRPCCRHRGGERSSANVRLTPEQEALINARLPRDPRRGADIRDSSRIRVGCGTTSLIPMA